MTREEFSITQEEIAEGIKLSIKGRIDSVNADELQRQVDRCMQDGKTNIVLNMLWVEYVSSSAIRVILKSFKDAKKAGGKLGIEQPSQNVRNVLGMVVLNELLIK